MLLFQVFVSVDVLVQFILQLATKHSDVSRSPYDTYVITVVVCRFADVKKMPLGKLSKAQVAKGFEALEAIEDAIEHKTKGASLADLTSKLALVTLLPCRVSSDTVLLHYQAVSCKQFCVCFNARKGLQDTYLFSNNRDAFEYTSGPCVPTPYQL